MALSLQDVLRRMLLIRTIEERLRALAPEFKAPPLAISMGQEAAALGVIDALSKDDLIVTNHRSMSHVIARGADPGRVLAEIYGKKTGYCQGRASFPHISIRELGIMLTSTIVGGELSLAPGVALGVSLQETNQIVTCFFGDGAACEGIFHESMNLAALWNLPILYVCENNEWQGVVSWKEALSPKSISSMATPYGIKSLTVDGTDVEAVHEATQAAAAYVRKERKPFLLEAVCYRLLGHHVLDPAAYMPKDELARALERDPVLQLSKRLAQLGLVSDEARAELLREVNAEVDRAFAFAAESPFPSPEDLLTHVYA